jgi:tRNA A-37 threonylcarbamoyl transferase component Bud32
MHRPRAARRERVAIGLALAAMLAIAAPAQARGNGHGASRRIPITEIPRQVIDPLVRDAVRGIQRTLEPLDPESRGTTMQRRAVEAEPEPEFDGPAPPALAEPEGERTAPEPVAPATARPAVEPEVEAVPQRRTSRAAIAALAAFAFALAFGAWRVRRRAPAGSVAADDLAPARVDDAFAETALGEVAPELLEAHTTLRRREPDPGLATRDEELRKRADALTVPRAALASPFPAAGRYEILGEIGRGGMGVVYRARDTRLDRIVALKRLSHHLRDHPRAVALLLQEARSAARLNHPNIVTVYDVDHEDGAYFITMELMEGQALDAVVQRRGKLTPKAAAWVGQHAAAGLAYAHERRIVHRDVKTANLFITRERSLKIMDFGLAKMVEEVRRRASLIAGTPSYMAPEQAQGIEVDGRADLYALGVTLFELLTGTLPFENGDPVYHHRNTPPPDPRERASEVPDAFAELVVQLMAKRPDERPAATSDVAARLAAFSGS